MRRLRDERGFTLIEMLVTAMISIIVFGATLSTLDVFQNVNRYHQLRNENQDYARNALDAIARELRSVNAPNVKYFGALEEAGAYSVMFQTVDATNGAKGKNTTGAMRVRYCLDDSTSTNEILWKQVKRWEAETSEAPTPTTCPDASSKDFENSTRLVSNVTNRIGGQNRPVFVYSASSVPQILSLESTLFVDVNPGHKPGETQLTTGVSLRNANRQPVALLKANKVKGEYVQLNASESYDPGGLALTYKWFEGAKELSSTAQEWETGKLAKGNHTFKLEVTNPGGLTATAEQTVKT
jgi:prepilin-type N-terminal cleavage/methylation domain-containing protein